MNDVQLDHILLVDDDEDDCNLFEEAFNELSVSSHLTIVHESDSLIQTLENSTLLPDLIFLDVNMPLKNGFECLAEIKRSERFKKVPIIIFSTSIDKEGVDRLYEMGATAYIQKPDAFLKFKRIINQVLSFNWKSDFSQPPREQFLVEGN